MRILVVGASGGVGRHVVAEAVSRGWDVRVLVRPETPYELPLAAGRVDVRRGSVLAAGVVESAARGVDAIVSALGSKRVNPANPWSRLASPPDFAEASARRLVEAAGALGVTRVVAVSAAGVGDSRPALNLPMRLFLATSTIGAQYADLERMESVYAASDLGWHAVRPVALFDGPRTGRARAVGGFGVRDWVARADVAAWMLDRVEDGRLEPRTPMISGPVVRGDARG